MAWKRRARVGLRQLEVPAALGLAVRARDHPDARPHGLAVEEREGLRPAPVPADRVHVHQADLVAAPDEDPVVRVADHDPLDRLGQALRVPAQGRDEVLVELPTVVLHAAPPGPPGRPHRVPHLGRGHELAVPEDGGRARVVVLVVGVPLPVLVVLAVLHARRRELGDDERQDLRLAVPIMLVRVGRGGGGELHAQSLDGLERDLAGAVGVEERSVGKPGGLLRVRLVGAAALLRGLVPVLLGVRGQLEPGPPGPEGDERPPPRLARREPLVEHRSISQLPIRIRGTQGRAHDCPPRQLGPWLSQATVMG